MSGERLGEWGKYAVNELMKTGMTRDAAERVVRSGEHGGVDGQMRRLYSADPRTPALPPKAPKTR